MVQTAQANGAADHGFPYGLDPREYGLNKAEYDAALRHHRDMEHHQVMHEQHDRHMKAMDWNAAERARIDAAWELKHWWLQPINEFCKWFGGAFWVVVWFWVAISVGSFLSDLSKRADRIQNETAQRACLLDVEKCRKELGVIWQKDLAR